MSDDNPDLSAPTSRTLAGRSVTSNVEISPEVVFGLLGTSDVNLRTLEQLLPADIHVRGNQVTLTGVPADVAAS
ncbi:phosphate starvation-inducible protein PhoH, partial [Streptomyces sp. SID10244]|nr:phosphate starvation-inducible protein PhoH [Streptomyces sp. SID10244]